MNKKYTLSSLGIKAKLIIGVMGVHIVLMTLFVVDTAQRQQVFLLHESTASALKQASLTADAASSWVLTEDVAGMAETLQSSRQDTPTRYAMIIDTNAQVLAHSDREMEGKFLTNSEVLHNMTLPHQAHVWGKDTNLIQVMAPVLVEGRLLGWVLLGIDTAQTYTHLRNISTNGLYYILAATVLGALAAWILAHFILRQLALILPGIDRLRDNHLDTPIPVITCDETGRVANALNRAMHSLLCSRQEIQREVQERHRAEQRIHFLSRRLMDGSEEERKRIGHDLHDELGQTVTGFQFGLHSLRTLLDENPAEARELCEKLIHYAEEMGEGVSRIAAHSWPVVLEHLGLSAAIRSLLTDCNKRSTPLNVSFHDDLPAERLDPRLELTCYRILQESLNNITRHSGAKNTAIRLATRADCITMFISDDGHGFNAQEAMSQWQRGFSGIGLIGMHERALLMGGHLEIISAPGEGCSIEVFFPLPQRPVEDEA